MFSLTKFFYNKSAANKVYIIPTKSGMLAFSLNFLILIFGLLFANNFLLLFNFVLFAFFVLSMFYTHFNLHGFKIIHLNISPNFAKSTTNIEIKIDSSSENNRRFDLLVNFYINENKFELESFNINSNQRNLLSSTTLPPRGIYQINRVEVSTFFPFNLFRSFIFFDLKSSVISFPRPRPFDNFHSFFSSQKFSNDEEIKLREYFPGDNVRNISWKKSTDEKIIYKELRPSRQNIGSIDFSNFIDIKNIENSLSELSGLIKHHHQTKTDLNCFHNKNFIGMINGEEDDYFKILTFLAAYEV